MHEAICPRGNIRVEGKLSQRNMYALGGDIHTKRLADEETCTQRRHAHRGEVHTEDNKHERDMHLADIHTKGDLHMGV